MHIESVIRPSPNETLLIHPVLKGLIDLGLLVLCAIIGQMEAVHAPSLFEHLTVQSVGGVFGDQGGVDWLGYVFHWIFWSEIITSALLSLTLSHALESLLFEHQMVQFQFLGLLHVLLIPVLFVWMSLEGM